MHFRYFGSTMGRFCKPDNVNGKLANPQSWNRYSYVVGNPVNLNDPTGHKTKQPGKPTPTAGGNNPGGPAPGDPIGPPLLETLPEKVDDNYFRLRRLTQPLTITFHPKQKGSKQLARRIVMGGEGLLNLYMAKIKLTGVSLLVLTEPEDGGASTPAIIILGLSAAGNLTSGGTQIVGALTGKTYLAEKGVKFISSVTSPTGLTTLIVTKGDVNKASVMVAFEGILTSDPSDIANGSLVDSVAKGINYVKNLWDVFTGSKDDEK